ncbi:TPA: hypothetical protein ROY17_005707 [Bacillus thuringiensis]|nr:hypothetical protein [Bacillus thuringiensis]
MSKKHSIFVISGALFIFLIGCSTNNTDTTVKNKDLSTSYTTEELRDAFPIGMPIDEYISKKNKMHIEHPTSIPLPDQNIGRVLKTSNGYIVICGNEKEVFDVLVFQTMEEVINYEKNLKQQSLINK